MAMMKQYVDVFLSPSTLHYISNNTVVGIWWHQFSALFWSSDFWLPSGRQWENIEPSNKFQYPNFHDVWVYPLLLSVGFILFRFFLLEPFVLEPLALAAAVPNKRPHPPPPSKTLETFYRLYGLKPSTKQLVEAADTSTHDSETS
ncbi:ceramide synthase 6-like [Homarus americanus]|uniref:ceramide synthase 6-like n=1 Tax=Homarus americanus TaxID=6706 RepID=UPI001C473B14|nr:ceramide synthase 6-like [Homarus americanus]